RTRTSPGSQSRRFPDARSPCRRAQKIRPSQGPPQLPVLEALRRYIRHLYSQRRLGENWAAVLLSTVHDDTWLPKALMALSKAPTSSCSSTLNSGRQISNINMTRVPLLLFQASCSIVSSNTQALPFCQGRTSLPTRK